MQQINGLHLLMDGFVQDPSHLAPEEIINLFDALVDELGMQYLQPPMALRVKVDPLRLVTDDDDGGWSVVAQITTSHIALHSWPLRSAFMMDIFSCKTFDAQAAEALVRQHLGVTEAKMTLVQRTGPSRGRRGPRPRPAPTNGQMASA